MDEVLDESIVKTKYESKEIPGYLNDFPVNTFVFHNLFGGYTYILINCRYFNLYIIYVIQINLINNSTK